MELTQREADLILHLRNKAYEHRGTVVVGKLAVILNENNIIAWTSLESKELGKSCRSEQLIRLLLDNGPEV